MQGRTKVVVALVLVTLAALVGAACAPVTTNPPAGVTGPSPGCGTTTQDQVTDEARTLSVDGRSRRYTLTVPPQHTSGTTTPIPLVLDFHGLIEGSVGTHPFATQFSELARTEGFAVAFPTGANDGFNWDVALDEANPDLQFIDELVAELGDTLCLDRSRVYITGLSFGASMTSMLMCMRPNTFAAAAPVAGIRNPCTATERKVPFVTFHGTADWILPYSLFEGVPQEIARKYGCVDTPAATSLGVDPGTGGEVTRFTWDCTAVDSAAEFYRIDNGGHSWPGSWFFGIIGFIVGPTTTELDATEVIWEFFERHQLD